ncbi:exonuclease domain-containing protein [Campylobacter sp. MOP51]|uniref:3'-5' exonuclease n=1 Tax=Campylobacter canis TaxID=3378588 RepID=UPI003C692BFA
MGLGDLTLPTSELNVAMARCDNLTVSNVELSLREWYQNWSFVTDVEKRVRNLVFFDTETHKLGGYIVSIGLLLYDMIADRVIDKYYSLVNPLVPMDAEAQAVHGISDDMVRDCNDFSSQFETIKSFFDRADLVVAFNAEYDIDTLIKETARLGIAPIVMPYLDVMKRLKVEVGAKNTSGRLKNPKLKECADFYQIPFEESGLHNSLYDTEVTLEVFKRAIARYNI